MFKLGKSSRKNKSMVRFTNPISFKAFQLTISILYINPICECSKIKKIKMEMKNNISICAIKDDNGWALTICVRSDRVNIHVF